MTKALVIIPARGGSKGVPGKNIKPLAGKPLICHTIEAARQVVPDEAICVSSDDSEIIATVEAYGLKVPFRRPEELATDTAGSYEVLKHALAHYEQQGNTYDVVVLMQATSPFRNGRHFAQALEHYTGQEDMVVSVKETDANPYFVLAEEDETGNLRKSKQLPAGVVRRQDAPKVYEYNGAIYVIKADSLKRYASFAEFPRTIKFEMDKLHSVDIDTKEDWLFCEFLIEKGIVTPGN